jgi:hypothetical protein
MMIDTKKMPPVGAEGNKLTGEPSVAQAAQRAQLLFFDAQKAGTQAGLIVDESDEEETSRILAMVREVFPNAKEIPAETAREPTPIEAATAARRSSSHAAIGQQLLLFADERNGHDE